jgi:alpha-mannosidase
MHRIREILVLHHSHLDVGYTHSQPIVWEMHREFLDGALEMLSSTADWPEISRPRWTCEVTAPVLRWMETAGESDLARFRTFVAEGRLGISGMQYNTSPLCSAELLRRQLAPVEALRRRLGTRIATVNQHDVNGVQWPFADIMIDAGIELLTMAANMDHGHFVVPRPGAFQWEAPSGRRLLVMNGSHYTMFDQLLQTWDNSVPRMREGLEAYEAHLAKSGYQHDFLYLTSTNAPEAWDNSPPNPWVAGLIRQWNETVRDPPIRYVTPELLLARLLDIPPASLPVLRGDWTDYWSFGSGSAAYETALSRKARFSLDRADLLRSAREAVNGRGHSAVRQLVHRAWESLALYAEHTWTYWDPAPGSPPTRAQSQLKAASAHESREVAEYLLINELEALSENPAQSGQPDHLLIVNPTQEPRTIYPRVPASWLKPGKSLRSSRFTWTQQAEGREPGSCCRPHRLPGFGWMKVPVSELRIAEPAAGIRVVKTDREAILESPFHRLSFDTFTGAMTSLVDKSLAWEVLSGRGELSFFDFVRERPDPDVDGSRSAIYERDLAREKLDIPCWKPGWQARREYAGRLLSFSTRQDPDSVTVTRELEAPGTRHLVQRIMLRADSPVIRLEATIDMPDDPAPEAVYFVFPIGLPEGWRCWFDAAGVPVELDREQLPGSCRGWMSVDTFACMGADGHAATLICPDANLVQAGDFSFGRLLPAVPRFSHPLLLAWPMNNYWNTNFPLSQPGVTTLRYGFASSGAFDAASAMTRALEFIHEPVVHPAFLKSQRQEGVLLVLEGRDVILNHACPAEDGRGIVVCLVNVGSVASTARVRPGDAPVDEAWLCGTLEDDRSRLPVVRGMAEVRLEPRRLTLVRICGKLWGTGKLDASAMQGMREPVRS